MNILYLIFPDLPFYYVHVIPIVAPVSSPSPSRLNPVSFFHYVSSWFAAHIQPVFTTPILHTCKDFFSLQVNTASLPA